MASSAKINYEDRSFNNTPGIPHIEHLKITCWDQGYLMVQRTLQIEIKNVNERPSDITVSPRNPLIVNENLVPGIFLLLLIFFFGQFNLVIKKTLAEILIYLFSGVRSLFSGWHVL